MIHYLTTAALPVLVIGGGVFFLINLGFFFVRRPIKTARTMASGKSPLRELCLSLAGTLGVGNIVGVSMAISLGGAGAVFWMWISAAICAVLKYAEITLAVKYRRFENGAVLGGPMYYMEDGVGGRHGRTLAVIFSVLGLLMSLVMGNLVQSRALTDAAERIFPAPTWVIGIALAALCALSIFGGYSAVSRVTAVIVPLMSAAYVAVSLWILISNGARVPGVVREIFASAFDIGAAGGGAVGFFTSAAIRHGVIKGVFSHEAGGGTAPLSHAQTKESVPARQGLLGLVEVFFDSGVICTLTAFVLLLAPAGDKIGTMRVYSAFTHFCGDAGGVFVSTSIILFAFSTMICWGYYGRTCLFYLSRNRAAINIYLSLYSAFAAVGAFVGEGRVWALNDVGVFLMTTINVISLIVLSGEVRRETERIGLIKPRGK